MTAPYRPDNPFVPRRKYRADNPFVQQEPKKTTPVFSAVAPLGIVGPPVAPERPKVVVPPTTEQIAATESAFAGFGTPPKRLPIPFDPEGGSYDFESAMAAGLSPDETGHWPSRVPETGLLLKGRKHPTWDKTLAGEAAMNMEVYQGDDGRWRSRERSDVPLEAKPDATRVGATPPPPVEPPTVGPDQRFSPESERSPLMRAEEERQAARDEVPGTRRMAQRAVAESLLATARQMATISGADAADTWLKNQVQSVASRYGDPESGTELATYIASRLGTDLAQFMAPGTALRAVGALPKGASFAGRMAQNIAAGAPIDVLQAATPETSIYPLVTGKEGTYPQRLATELAADVGLSGIIEGVRGVRRAPTMASRPAAEPLVERAPERRQAEVPVPQERRIQDRRLAQAVEDAQSEITKMDEAIAETKRLAGEQAERVDRLSGPEPVLPPRRQPERPAGAPADDAAIQEDLLGAPKLMGREQAELLPETAGVPQARLKGTPIQPDEMARVRREGAEPAGERPGELFQPGQTVTHKGRTYTVTEQVGGRVKIRPADAPQLTITEQVLAETPPEPEFRRPQIGSRKSPAKLSDDELVERYAEVSERLDKKVEQLQRREQGQSGTTTKKEAYGRAKLLKGSITNDNKLLARIGDELQKRGMDPDDAIDLFYERVGIEAGAVRPAVLQTLTGAGVGATVGAGVAPEDKKTTGAVVGGLAGAGLVGVASMARRPAVAAPAYLADPSIQSVLGTVSKGLTPQKTTLHTLASGAKESANRLYTKVFNEAFPLERFGREVGGDATLQQEVARARGWKGAAAQRLRDDFRQVVQVTKGHEEGVIALTKAQRALELLDAGLEKTDIPRDVLEDTVRKLSAIPEVQTGADALRQYYRGLLDRKLAEGVLDPAQHAAIVASGQYYVPFTRDFGADVLPGVGREGKLVSSRTGVRRMDAEKARAATTDPFEQAIRDTFETERRISKQRVTNVVAEIVEADATAASPFIREIPNNAKPKHGRVVQANVGGTRKTYEVVDPDLYEAWGAFEPYTGNLLVRILRYPKTWLREGVTALPDFGIANAIRDNVMSAIQYPFAVREAAAGTVVGAGVGAATSDDKVAGAAKGAALGLGIGAIAPHIARTLDAMRDIVGPTLGGNRALYEEWLREGGAGFGFYVRNQGDARKVLTELKRTGVEATDVVSPRQWWKVLQTFNRAIEEAPRVARYKYLKGQGASVAEAVAGSRDISLDFARLGSDMKGVSAMAAFFNAQVQGWDKLVRMLKNPKTWAVGAGMITAPSVALWSINKDNEEYWDRPLWERNLFWLVPKGDGGGFWRIPKPFEIGFLFASIPERILDYAHQKDPEALAAALKDIGGQYGVGGLLPIPTAIEPIIENVADYDFFTRRPVNPEQYANVPPEMQYTDRTPTVAVRAGEALGASPAKVENLIRGYTGSLGGEVLDATSAAARATGVDTRPGPAEPRIPLLGRFQTRETNVTEREQAVRRKWKKADAVYTATRRLLKAGQTEQARAYAEKHRDDLAEYARLKATKGMLDEITELRRTVSRSPWPPERRRAALVQLNDRLSRVLAQQETQ